jgi:iduronate 2-sulfatase
MMTFCVAAMSAARHPVVMIAVDDLRTQLSVYPEGGPEMHTPNIERLASKAVVFERAYVQVALCMPSRTSLLTSRRPDTSRSWTIEGDQWFRLSGGNFTTLPGAFRDAGYLAVGMGKVFHEGQPPADKQDCSRSWSPVACLPPTSSKEITGGPYDPVDSPKIGGKDKLAHPFDDDLEPLSQDGNLTDHAVRTLQSMASGGYGADVANGSRPFFLAVGFHRPHVPWIAPKRFWEYYPIDSVPPVPHPGLVTSVAPESLQDWQVRSWCSGETDMKGFCGAGGEAPLSSKYPLDNTTVPTDGATYMRQAYFAATSWTDANVGRVLDALDATPFAAAIICFWGDHGWHLGDNDQWAKMTNYEHATKIPLIIGCPGGGCIGRSPALVEAIDIMPTLLELAGLPIPACPPLAPDSRATSLCTEGRSLAPLVHSPAAPVEGFTSSFSQFPRPEHPGDKREPVDVSCRARGITKGCTTGPCLDGCPNKMGYTIRTDLYRYTAWVGFNKCSDPSCPDALANWTDVLAVELYNHSDSPVPRSFGVETENIAGRAGSAAVEASLFAQLHNFNTQRIPPPPTTTTFSEHPASYCSIDAGTGVTRVFDKKGLAQSDCEGRCAADAACACFDFKSDSEECRIYHGSPAVKPSTNGYSAFTRDQ